MVIKKVLTNRVRTVGDQFQIKHMGRWFAVVARFPDTQDGIKEANDYMVANQGACVLVVADGWINLSQYSDKGQTE